MSNGGYRKKEPVKEAQKKYDNQLHLANFNNEKVSELKNYKLFLPINNKDEEK